VCPKKNREAAISGRHLSVGRKSHEDHHARHCVVGARDGQRRRDDYLCEEGTGFVGLRGPKLLIIRPARVVMGATVFVIGVLTGAGIAMWVLPPV
jgi:hypothetical protein